MSEVLVILDGASEPLRGEDPTSLERAETPILDALAHAGFVGRLQTIPDGLPVGSETGCSVLLGWVPPGPVDRGVLEAAAREIELAPGVVARRVDVLEAGARASAERTAEAASGLRARGAGVEVHGIDGHRLLLVGAESAVEALLAGLPAARTELGGRVDFTVWPTGAVPPRILDSSTVVVAAVGAVSGLARLLGAQVITPFGATGGVDCDLEGLAVEATERILDETPRVIVHVGGADEAAHERDADAKVAFIERVDRELIMLLAGAVHEHEGRLTVAPDHGCDPKTGKHDGAPVPALFWESGDEPEPEPDDGELTEDDLPVLATPKRRHSQPQTSGRRLTERWAEPLPIDQPEAARNPTMQAETAGVAGPEETQ